MTVAAVICFIGGGLGVAGGHFAYDTAKLIRRQARRKRKLAQELSSGQ